MELTQDEYTILNWLPKKWKWIARDCNGDLRIFTSKPVKYEDIRTYKLMVRDKIWVINSGKRAGNEVIIFPYKQLFKFIKYSDASAYNIDKLLKIEKKHKDHYCKQYYFGEYTVPWKYVDDDQKKGIK